MGLLSQCLNIYALDLPGFGDLQLQFRAASNRLTVEQQNSISRSVRAMACLDFETDKIVKIIAAFVDQNVPAAKKMVLIGHSMGSHLLIKLATRLRARRVEASYPLSA